MQSFSYIKIVTDYCNTVLAGAPRTITDKLLRVLNAAMHVITSTWKLIAAWGSNSTQRTSLA